MTCIENRLRNLDKTSSPNQTGCMQKSNRHYDLNMEAADWMKDGMRQSYIFAHQKY